MRIATIVGARPQFIKAAMISREIHRRCANSEAKPFEEVLVHTGQHFDANMSDVFFEELELPQPDFHLGVAGGGHGEMTGRMLERLEPVLLDVAPDWALVYGDTNSTLAGALAAAKLHIPVAHVEAGLRSFNRRMPEEINRVLTDHIASLLFAPTRTAVANLRREGILPDRIDLVGDVMYDAMLFYRAKAEKHSRLLDVLHLEPKQFALATVHRAENTDDRERLKGIMEGLERVAETIPVVLPLHPRTRQALRRFGMLEQSGRTLKLIQPVSYLGMVALESSAAVVVTDSGGIQKEAYFNGVPCLTLRDETEWVELVEAGANILVGTEPQRILSGFEKAKGTRIEISDHYGDGQAARAILQKLHERTDGHTPAPTDAGANAVTGAPV